jgi:long-chain fatty acid transport protein
VVKHIAAIGCLVLNASLAHAQGFGVYEQGACTMARGGAAVADPCADGSAIYLNPAGIARGQGMLGSLGGTLIAGDGSFTADAGGVTDLVSPIGKAPHGYLQYGFRNGVALGIGMYVPYGLGIEWPLTFGGRFITFDSHLDAAYIQPTLAYALNDRVSFGGGLVFALSSVNVRRREDLSGVPLGTTGLTFGALVPPQTDFVTTELAASRATGLGANLGIIVGLHDRFSVGVRYLTPVSIEYEGTATFTPLLDSYRVTQPNALGLPVGTPIDALVGQVQALLQSQDVRTELEMPAQFTAGVSIKATSVVTVLADYQRVGWASFETVTLDFAQPIPPDEQLPQNYRDTSAVRVGVVGELPRMRLSGGYFYNQAAAPDETVTPLLPEARRNHLTAGVGWNMGRRLTVDVAYQFVRHADRRGRIVNPPPGQVPTVALNSGVYRERAQLLGVTMTLRP